MTTQAREIDSHPNPAPLLLNPSECPISAAWSGWQRWAKRILDIILAGLLLVLVAPVMALIAIAIFIDSRGPIIFRQTRVGKDGQLFTIYKFRGMVVDAEEKLATIAHLNEADGPLFKMRRDPRVTRVGRVLRSTSLDELPQLWNVMRGEMSVVGPRPPLPAEVARYTPLEGRRLLVTGGITGLWQVCGRSRLGFDDMVRLDLEYVARWSLWLDLCILSRTAVAVISRNGAY